MTKHLLKGFVSLFLSIWLIGCQSNPGSHLKIAASAVPHAEILEFIQSDLKDEGVELDIVIVEDFNTPNRALADKEVDANYFQHVPFMEAQEKDFGYQFEVLAAVQVEPMGLYSKKIDSLRDLKPKSIVAVPNDPTNQARALRLLHKEGLIELSDRGILTSVHDIIKNPHQLEILELDPAMLSRTLDDVDLAAITTNFALQGGLAPEKDSLAFEETLDSPFANIIAIRRGESARPDFQKLKATIQSDKVRIYLSEKYHGAILPAF